MKKKHHFKTKKLRGIDLPPWAFLYVGDIERPATWLLPVNGFVSKEFTKQLIRRNVEVLDQILPNIPKRQHTAMRYQLAGACQSYGIDFALEPAPVVINADEMTLLQEATSFSERMLRLCELDSLYND